MKRNNMKTLFALLFSFLLFGGGYGTALAQEAGSEEKPRAMGGMMEMMENCPMMQDGEKRAAMMEMMEQCPMMKDGAEMDHAAMMAMMKECPMMQGAMKDCPMMKQMMKGQGTQHEGMRHGTGDASRQSSAVETTGGVQEVKVTVGPMGFAPKQVALEAGVPARLVFTRTADGGCVYKVQSPELGLETTELPLGEPVTFEFTPEEAGTYTFACGMGMMKGTIVVGS